MANKVVVPEEMKKVAEDGFMRPPNGVFHDKPLIVCILNSQLPNALLEVVGWLDEKLTRMRKDKGSPWRDGYNTAIEDVRRMYLAPESSSTDLSKLEESFNNALDRLMMSYPLIIKTFPGIDKKVRDQVRMAIEEMRKSKHESQVPEEIKDFSKWIDVNYPGISRQWETELFIWNHNRRGQKSVNK